MSEYLHTTEVVPLDDLTPHPQNYRSHPEDQLAHIKRSIEENGLYRNVVVAKDGTILAGHGVVEAATELGMNEMQVIRLDVEPDSPLALKVLVGDNEISNLAMVDDRLLTDTLKLIKDAEENGTGLEGTGFDEQALAAFAMVTRGRDELADFDAAKEWAGAGMPDYDAGNEIITATVQFLSEEDREKFLEFIGQTEKDVQRKVKGYSLWWPRRGQQDLRSLRMESTESDPEAPDATPMDPEPVKKKRGRQRNGTAEEVLAVMRERNEEMGDKGIRPARPFMFTKVPRTASESMSSQFTDGVLDYLRTGKPKVAQELYAMGREVTDPLSICHNHLPMAWMLESGLVPREEYERRFTFAFTRNPWTRAISLWRLQTQMGHERGDGSFRSYIEYLRDHRDLVAYKVGSKKYAITSPQVHWLMPDMDFIGSYERLNDDFAVVAEAVGMPGFELTRHVSYHGGNKKKVSASDVYDDELIELVRDLYADDVDLLGYDGPDSVCPFASEEIKARLLEARS